MAVNLSETREFYRQFKSQLTAEVVAGSDKQLQYNNNGVLGASSNLVFDYTNSVLVVHRESNSLGATTTLALKNEDLTDGISVGLDFQAFDSNSTLRTAARIASIIDSHDASDVTSRLVFGTSSNQHMTINSSGNVGIGIDNPASILHLQTLNSPELRISRSNNAGVGSQPLQISAYAPDASGNTSESFGDIRVTVDDATHGGENSHWSFRSHNNGTVAEDMVIGYYGNVGIEATPDIYIDGQHRVIRLGKSMTMMSKEAASVSVPSYIRNNIDFIRINGNGTNSYISPDGYPAEQITLYQGELIFYNAPAGIGGDSTSLTTGKNYIIIEAPTSPTNEFSANFGAAADTAGTLFTSTATGTAASGLVRETATLTERFKIDINGQMDLVTNVGTNDSAAGLSIHNTSTSQIGLSDDADTYGGGVRFYFTDASGTDDKLSAAIIARKKNAWSSAVATNKDADIEFHTLDNDVLGRRMVITPNGSVWMGNDTSEMPNFVTTSDQVSGDEFGRLVVGKNNTHTSGVVSGADMHINVWNSWASDTVDKGSFLGFSDNFFANPNYFNVTRAAIKGATEVASNNASGYMSFYTSGATANNLTEKMRITSAGDVGIGTDSVDSRLHVNNSIASTGVGSSSSPIAIIQNVRPNTGSSSSVLRFDTNEVSGTNQYQRAAIGAEYDGDSNVNGRLMFATADTSGTLQERMRITSNGNIGIGISTLSDWSSVFGNTIQMGTPNSGSNSITSDDKDNFRFLNNLYLEENGGGGNWKYYADGTAATYQMDAGSHRWYSLPSGNAGDSAGSSFLEVLRVEPTFWAGGSITKVNINGTSDVAAGGTDPVYLRITDNGQDGGGNTWNVDQDFTQLQFYSGDASAPNLAGVRWSIGTAMQDTPGTKTDLIFRKWSAGASNTGTLRLSNDGSITIGSGHLTATTSSGIITAPYGTGTDIDGGDFNIYGGRSTGTGAGGDIIFHTSPTGATGTGVNAHIERMRITYNGSMRRDLLPGSSNRTTINNDSGGGFASSYVDVYDKNIVLSTPTISTAQLSPISIDAADEWYVVFEGFWQNTVEGTGFTTYSTIRHVSSDDPTFAVGGVTVTIQRNTGDGTLELYKNSISYVQFVGKVTVILENGSPLPNHSMILSRNLRVGSTTKPTATVISIEGNSGSTTPGGNVPTLELRNSNTTNDTFSAVEFFNEASNGDNTISAAIRGAKSADHTTYTSGYLTLDTVSTGGVMNERMRITSDGEVGIGVTEPQSTLEVVNSFAIQAVNDNAVKRSFVKRVQGTGVTNALQISIPAQNVFVFIKMKFAGSRALTASTDQGTSTVGEYYYAIARNGSGSDVVLDNNVGSQNWSSATTSAGGAQNTQTSPATTIVRNGSEANTAAQVVNITLDVQIIGGSTGNYLCDFDILMSENGAGGNITLL